MNNSETAHCRLCAKIKPYSKLVNLQTDEDKRGKVMEKLNRLSLETTDLSSDDTLSKTVCFPCMDSLDSAFNFVINVEAAQSKLNEFMTNNILKQEVNEDDNIYWPIEENYVNTAVKVEFDNSSDLEVTNKGLVNDNVNIKKEDDSYSDNIPVTLTWKDYSWLCAYCDTIFPNIDELKQHSMAYHGCCNPYRCSDCNIRKLSLDSFVKHVKHHRQHLKLSCYKCHMAFPRPYDTIKHKKEHLATKFNCAGCNETFPTLKQSVEHSNSYNKDKKLREVPIEHLTDDFTCVFCPKKFKHKGGLTQHLLIHTERKRDHTCEKCGKCFLNKSNLAGHMMLHEGSRPHQCEICKHQFRTLSQLRAHVGIHDGKKPFSCEQCGRLFRLRSQLNSHSIVHTDSLPFVCSYCHKRFRFKTILNQHVRQHTGLRPYECQICHRDFTNWPNYNKHMKRRHDMNMAKRKQTPEGLLTVDPATGEANIDPESDNTAEWKRKILDNSNQPGRPKNEKIKKTLIKSNKTKS